ncbi:3-keto-5-aminohexanoate cleavage protein [bacterium]|nr:3-keto-5-aminohexanoate cleavage protein [bacterium]
MKNHKTVITCAITGAATKPEQTPYLPITPEQIAESALEAAEAGAAIAHIHVRNIENGRPSMSLELYRDTVDRIKSRNKELIINLTTGPGALYIPSADNLAVAAEGTRLLSAAERVKHIEVIKPDICTMDLNTMNLPGAGIRINHIRVCREMIQRVQAVGVKPELELFDSGDLRIALELLEEGVIQKPALWQFAMGMKYGWDATPATVMYAYNQLPPGAVWSAFGISRTQMPMVAQTWIYGGHVRVGMEDNIYIEKGVLAKSNAELVRKAANIVKDLGGQIANAQEARELFHLK